MPAEFPFSGVSLYSKEVDWGVLDKRESEFDDARAAQFCVDFLNQPHGQPFFLACGIFRPHLPWYFPKQYLELYPLDEIVVPEDLPEDLDDIPEAGRKLALRKYVDMKKTRDAGQWTVAIQHYLASISFADAQVGKVLDALDMSSYAENTIIVVWSDHGWHLGEKQHWHKRTLWEECTRIPMMVVAPGIGEPGRTSIQPVSTVDLFPTLIELCNLSPPQQQLDGLSLVPWLLNPEKTRVQAALTVDEHQNLSARSQRYRCIQYADGSEEFYDHQADTNEWTNLINQPQHKEAIQRMREQIPENMAPPAKDSKAFDFNPSTYTWTDRQTGQRFEGRAGTAEP